MTQYIGITQYNHITPSTTLKDILYNNEFHIGILDDKKRSAVARTFTVQGLFLPHAAAALGARAFPPDLRRIVDFIVSHVDDPISAQVICEIPSVQFPKDAPLPTLLLLLNIIGCCTCTFAGSESQDPREPASFGLLPPPMRQQIEAQILSSMIPEAKAQVRQRGGRVLGADPLLLGTGVGRAYADFLLGQPASLGQSAIGAAIIGTRPSTHTYLFSSGRVQSAHDVVTALQNFSDSEQSETLDTTAVFSADEIFTQRCTKETILERLDKIPLEYAVTVQKYKHLGEREGLKMALLAVSKRWKIELYCCSSQMKKSAPTPASNQRHPCVRPEWLVSSPRGAHAPWLMSLLAAVSEKMQTVPG